MTSSENRGKYTAGFLKTEFTLLDFSNWISRTRQLFYTCEDTINFFLMVIPILAHSVTISVAFGVSKSCMFIFK